MVRRILSLWRLYARMDFMWLIKDFGNCAICAFTEIVVSLSSVTGVWLIAERFAGIGGLSRQQVLFMLAYSIVVNGILSTFFNFNVLHISRRIGRGQLDHVLMQPGPVWMTLITEGFVPASGSGVLLTGSAFLAFTVVNAGWDVSLVWVAALIISLVLSAAVNLTYSFLWGSLAFFAPVAAEEVCTSVVDLFSTLRSFPLNGIGKSLQFILITVLPVGLCAWYPSIALASGKLFEGLGIMFVLAFIHIAVTLIVFRKGLKHYVKKGSYRYHDRGHRR